MTNSNQISDLAAGTKLDLLVAEIQGTVTVKKLRTRNPRKGELWGKGQGGGRAVGAVGTQDTVIFGQAATGSRWAGDHNQCGIGANAVDNLSGVVRNANRVYEATRKADAIARRAEVAARKQAALDELLAEVQG